MEVIDTDNRRCSHVDIACEDLVVTRGLLVEDPRDMMAIEVRHRPLVAATLLRCQGDGCPLLKRVDFLSTPNA